MTDYTSRDFLRELAELRQALRRDIHAHEIGLSKDGRAERRKRVLQGDFKYFAYTYFPHHIRGEPSRFQAQFCDRFPQLLDTRNGCREWWIAPRGECKSSLLTKIGPVWIIVRELLQRAEIRAEARIDKPPLSLDYGLLLGAEASFPTKLIEVAKTELTCNAALNFDFPEVCGKSDNWKVGGFTSRSGVTIEPFGASQAMRGTFSGASRPKWLFGDDLITDSEAKSPTERENRWSWLEKAVDYLGPPDGTVKFMVVGTVLNADDPLSRAKQAIGHVVHHFKALEAMPDRMDLWEQCEELMRNADPRAEDERTKLNTVCTDDDRPSFKFWKRNRKEMSKGAVTSWPAVRSLYWLMRQRAKNLRAFETEMQGIARNAEDTVFTGWQFWVHKDRAWTWYGACDPSMGKGESADPSAIVIGAWSRVDLKLHVERADIKRRVPTSLQADLIKAQQEYACICWAFENNNAYEFMRQAFVKAGVAAGVPLPLAGVTATVPPEVRIGSLEPFINDRFSPRILFKPGLTRLLDELQSFPEPQNHHHYDGLTALHLLWHIASTRGGNQFRVFTAPVTRAGRRA